MTEDPVTWIVLADGARARVWAEPQRLGPVRELTEWAREGGRNVRSGKGASRVHDRIGHPSHTSVRQSGQDRAEQAFLTELAADLDQASADHSFDRLVLVAPAKALGFLRQALSARLMSKVETCDSKDLVDAKAETVRRELSRARARYELND